MREICFKAISKDSGKWVEGDLYRYFDKVLIVPINSDRINYCEIFDAVEVDPETVCQFTGLYDSTKWQDLTESEREQWTRSGSMPSEWNGKRIFEGDVAKLKHCTAHYTCTWAPEAACFYWQCNVTNDHSNIHHEAEIIGNIHDRKEGV